MYIFKKTFNIILIITIIGVIMPGCNQTDKITGNANIMFLHHSTGNNIWNGGVQQWFEDYNAKTESQYHIEEQYFPKGEPYPWNNYPYDYWNIWVKNAGDSLYMEEPTLEILTKKYQAIIFKHCFPVSAIKEDTGNPDIESSEKRLENYKLQYNALKKKLHQFPNNQFIVWTNAALVKNHTDEASGKRSRMFVDWVKNQWDEKNDNIYLFDFFELETEGGIMLKDEYAASSDDSHPNETFSKKVAPLFCQRIIDIISGKGDSTSLTGE